MTTLLPVKLVEPASKGHPRDPRNWLLTTEAHLEIAREFRYLIGSSIFLLFTSQSECSILSDIFMSLHDILIFTLYYLVFTLRLLKTALL